MKIKLRNYKAAVVTLAAIAVLAISLAFTVWRLLNVEQDLRTEDTHTNLWQISQTQFEASIFAEVLARTAAGETFADPEQAPTFRLAILISRLTVLLEGPQGKVIDRVGELESLKEAYLRLTHAEPLLEKGIDTQTATMLRVQVRDLAYQLRDITNKVTLLVREEAMAKRSTYLRYVFESFAFIIGIAVSAAFLLVRLFKGMQETTQAKQLLKQEQELSDLVINNISDQGIVMFDAHLRCLLWNPGMEDLLNLKPDQAVGQHMQDLDPIFAREDVSNSLIRATEGMSSILENEASSPDGQERCLEINCFPVYMAERKLGIAFMRDVTEQWLARKQTERQNFDLEIKVLQRTAALRQAERRLIAAIKSASEGFAAFDWTGKLLFANEQIWAAAPVSLWCQDEMDLSGFLRCFAMCEGADMRLVSAQSPFEELELDLRVKKDTWARLSLTKADGATIFVRLTDISGYKQVAKALESALNRERETTSAYRTSCPWCLISSGRPSLFSTRVPSAFCVAGRT
jgi:PAS domain S-box-containing protein